VKADELASVSSGKDLLGRRDGRTQQYRAVGSRTLHQNRTLRRDQGWRSATAAATDTAISSTLMLQFSQVARVRVDCSRDAVGVSQSTDMIDEGAIRPASLSASSASRVAPGCGGAGSMPGAEGPVGGWGVFRPPRASATGSPGVSP